jgi:formylglycine-generating enzyme required for sulfatase activity
VAVLVESVLHGVGGVLRRSPALLLLALCVWPGAASAAVSWPLHDYNPSPMPGDLLLPLPCDGALAFRPVPTGGPPGDRAALPPALHWLLDVQGSFHTPDGPGDYFLLGKYEVTARQFAAVMAVAEGGPCPFVDEADAALPMVDIRRAEAAAFAEALSGWWAEQGEVLPDCVGGASPCLPRVDGTVASVRLPTEKEWEYALRGGDRVSAAEFAARRYPMPNGLARSAWYQDNANELRAIGLRDPSPLGLHDMLGNAEEILADNYQEPRGTGPVGGLLVRGGSAWTPAEQLVNDRRIEQPGYNHTEDTGFRVLAFLPVIRDPEDARRFADPPQDGDAAGPPPEPPPEPPPDRPPGHPPEQPADQSPQRPTAPPDAPRRGGLDVRIDQPAALWLDGRPRGRLDAGETVRLRDLPVGEHELRLVVAGQPDMVKRVRVEPDLVTSLDLHLPPPDRRPEPPPAPPPEPPTAPRPLPPGLPFEPAMIALPGGTLLLGSPDSEPERDTDEGLRGPVSIGAFAIGRTEVTRGELRAFAAATRRLPPPAGGDDLPAAGVSWDDARDYAAWLASVTGRHYRLPTEAEWEYAARAGTTTPFWTGNCIDTDHANYNGHFDYAGCGAETGRFRNAPVPAGSLPANPFGLHEVHGNVAEWTADCWRDDPAAPASHAPAPVVQQCDRRVLRGGFFDQKPHLMRAANRSGVAAGIRRYNIGFRVARDLQPAAEEP